MSAHTPYSPRLTKAILLSHEAATRMGTAQVGTEQLLLGLLGVGEGYAKKRHISLSKLIQDFLENSIENESLKEDTDANIPQEIQELRGILKGPDTSKKQLKQMKYDRLKEKYGL